MYGEQFFRLGKTLGADIGYIYLFGNPVFHREFRHKPVVAPDIGKQPARAQAGIKLRYPVHLIEKIL